MTVQVQNFNKSKKALEKMDEDLKALKYDQVMQEFGQLPPAERRELLYKVQWMQFALAELGLLMIDH